MCKRERDRQILKDVFDRFHSSISQQLSLPFIVLNSPRYHSLPSWLPLTLLQFIAGENITLSPKLLRCFHTKREHNISSFEFHHTLIRILRKKVTNFLRKKCGKELSKFWILNTHNSEKKTKVDHSKKFLGQSSASVVANV